MYARGGSVVVENTDFDRLYFYGSDKPIHVSYGPEYSRNIVIMQIRKNGKKVPKNIAVSDFLDNTKMDVRAKSHDTDK